MKKLYFLLPLLLTGCMSVPITPKWPGVPDDLKKTCPDLKTVEQDNEKLSVLLETVTDNYKNFYDCKSKVDDWIEWYDGQQKIWEKLK